jgi:RNA polymerase sigma-70 factor, ECF subfamily
MPRDDRRVVLHVSSLPPDPATGSEERFARWVVPEIEVLLRVARTLTRPADAEDLVQDTLLRAYKAIDRFDGRHPRAWLLTIMRNAQLNRTRRRRPELLDDPDRTLAEVAGTGSDAATPESLVVGDMFDTVVDDAFNRLPEAFRQALELVDIAGLSYQETADALGIPVGTVMSRIHRARHRIRERLAAAGLAPRSPR